MNSHSKQDHDHFGSKNLHSGTKMLILRIQHEE